MLEPIQLARPERAVEHRPEPLGRDHQAILLVQVAQQHLVQVFIRLPFSLEQPAHDLGGPPCLLLARLGELHLRELQILLDPAGRPGREPGQCLDQGPGVVRARESAQFARGLPEELKRQSHVAACLRQLSRGLLHDPRGGAPVLAGCSPFVLQVIQDVGPHGMRGLEFLDTSRGTRVLCSRYVIFGRLRPIAHPAAPREEVVEQALPVAIRELLARCDIQDERVFLKQRRYDRGTAGP